MVAEPSVDSEDATKADNSLSLGDINMIEPPPGLDFTEAERRIKQEIIDKVAAATTALRTVIMDMINNLNQKMDTIKTAQDTNDAFVKSEIDKHLQEVKNNVNELKVASNNTWTRMDNVEAKVTATTDTIYRLQSQGVLGQGTGGGPATPKGIMELKVTSNLEKTLQSTGRFWNMDNQDKECIGSSEHCIPWTLKWN